MENNAGGFSSSDAVLWGAMNNMGRGGYGGGAWGGGYGGGGHAPFASPGSNAVRINRNADIYREGIRNTALTLDRAEESRRFSELKDGQFQSELRTCDKLSDLQGVVNDSRFEAKDCCCETQKEILRLDANNNLKFAEIKTDLCGVESRLTAEIKAIETRTLERELNRAERREQTQTILSTCGCGCGGGVRPCPPV